MNNTGGYIAIVATIMVQTCGGALDMNTLLSLLLSAFIVSFTLPSVSGSGIIGLSSVFAAVGVPVGAVTLFLCLEPIEDMADTIGNVAANVTSTLNVSAKD